MNKSEPKYFVYLTSDAVKSLKDSALSIFIDGRKIRCLSAQENGYFLNIVAVLEHDKYGNISLNISIPLNFVLYIISEHITSPKKKKTPMGFILEKLEN
ncbi:MAG: hypothetical protein HYZ34_07700 [Ignavibacteriae bacterium]|nr:hypothetical protein [Ignavibacteriota bacterium]